MAVEQTKNKPVTILDGSIDDSTTTVVVIDGSVFPSTGNFRILIDSEIMLVTARSSNTLTVTRAQENTSAASHDDEAIVTGVFTAGALDQMLIDRIPHDTFANIPSAGLTGRIYVPTDTNYVFRDSGSNYAYMHGLNKFTQPVLGDFTWLNQGTATTDTTKGGITVTVPNVGGQNLRVLHKSKTPPYKVTAFFILNGRGQHYESCGLGFYDPTGGRLTTMHLIHFGQADTYSEVCNWNSATSFNSAPAGYQHSSTGTRVTWMQIENDNTNIYFRVSNDGYNWIHVYSAGKTAFMTTAPTKVLFYGRNDTGVADHTFHLLSWKET